MLMDVASLVNNSTYIQRVMFYQAPVFTCEGAFSSEKRVLRKVILGLAITHLFPTNSVW
jgi:hypothetical protein